MIVGVTGNTGSGKTTLANLFADWGATLVDADAVGRGVWSDDPGLQRAIIATFGDGVRGGDGRVDRRRLGRVVFSSPERLAELDRLLAKPLRAALDRALREAERKSPGPVVLDAALLFDWGYEERVDVVVLILSGPETRRARIQARDDLDAQRAKERIESQKSLDGRAREADHVIENDGTLEDLERRAREVWASITDQDKE